ncbi:MAG: methyltransferase domain-containing protein [Alphaproteobacteria bacterium]|nr:methyltransferase domain-containing protein [Alphaproteobacteria bacterium]
MCNDENPARWADQHAAALARVAPLVDRQLSPLGLATIDALGPRPGETILDIGCGAGQTLSQIGKRVGHGGRVIGVDIAPVLLSVARERSTSYLPIELIEADAQTLALPDGSVDGVFSRFGVMGFTDPAAAFRNFGRMLRPGGRLAFCCWRTFEENELDYLPVFATGRTSDVRGTPFSFSDPDYVRNLLGGVGFENVAINAYEELVSCGGLDETVEVLLSVGALGQMVRSNPALRDLVEPSLRHALAARSDPSDIKLSAAVWIVSAQVGN